MKERKTFWDKNAGRYDRFMRKDRAAYEGGDEFVVICCPVTQEKFEQQVEALRAALVRHQVDAAIGSFWQSLVEDLPAFLREADDRMYREKERQKRAARPSVQADRSGSNSIQ